MRLAVSILMGDFDTERADDNLFVWLLCVGQSCQSANLRAKVEAFLPTCYIYLFSTHVHADKVG